MRNKIYALTIGLLAVIFCCSVYSKEQLLRNGEVFYLRLTPVDPRSIMQGDYMELDYSVNNSIYYYLHNEKTGLKIMKFILSKDERGIAHSPEFYRGQPLAPNQIKVNLVKTKTWRQYSVAPTSFMFQEGHAEIYEKARYAVLKTDGSGKVLLTGLAFEDLSPVKPEEKP